MEVSYKRFGNIAYAGYVDNMCRTKYKGSDSYELKNCFVYTSVLIDGSIINKTDGERYIKELLDARLRVGGIYRYYLVWDDHIEKIIDFYKHQITSYEKYHKILVDKSFTNIEALKLNKSRYSEGRYFTEKEQEKFPPCYRLPENFASVIEHGDFYLLDKDVVWCYLDHIKNGLSYF